MNFEKICREMLEAVDLKGTTVADYNKKTLEKGAKVEAEHTTNKSEQKKIAMQHMAEFPKKDKDGKIDSDYYEELEELENDLKSKRENTFDELIRMMLTKENMTSGGGESSVFGDSPEIGAHGGAVGNDDWYARGDARNLFGGGTKKSKKKKKKSNVKSGIMPLLVRNIGIKS